MAETNSLGCHQDAPLPDRRRSSNKARAKELTTVDPIRVLQLQVTKTAILALYLYPFSSLAPLTQSFVLPVKNW